VADKVSVLEPSADFRVRTHTTLVTGVLKGFDQLLNLVLDNVEEHSSGLSLVYFRACPKAPSPDFRSVRRGPREEQEARISGIKRSHYHSHQPHRRLRRNRKSVFGGRVAVHLVHRIAIFESIRAVRYPQTPSPRGLIFAAHIRIEKDYFNKKKRK
jgi:small nuclear ribonucleoprotein (snRNP)-like protein